MSRSKWKGPFIDTKHLTKIKNLKKKTNNKKILNISRNSEIMPLFLGLTFNVYNGKIYSNVTVSENMIGHKFGEFSLTRATFVFKKKKLKKKLKKK